MQILIVTDIILDVLLNRTPFSQDAENLWKILISGKIPWYISESGFRNIQFHAERIGQPEIGNRFVSCIEKTGSICHIDFSLLEKVRLFNIPDAESAVEVACATENNLDAIITQNPQNFDGAGLLIFSVREFLESSWLKEKLDQGSLPIRQVNDASKFKNKLLHSFYVGKSVLDAETPVFHPLEVTNTLKYRIRNSITTVLEVFKVLRKEGSKGMSREELGRIANRSDQIKNIILDLRKFSMVVCQGERVVASQDLLKSKDIEIANHLAKTLNQHVVTKNIYNQLNRNENSSIGYLQALIAQVGFEEKLINTKSVEEYENQEYLQLAISEVWLDKISSTTKCLSIKSVGDYTSRMLGWLLFTGLMEARSKEIIAIPIGEGRQKGKLIEETEVQQLELFNTKPFCTS